MVSIVRSFVRGCLAWTVGYVVTIGFLVGGVAGTSIGTFGSSARVFIDAHRFVVADVIDPSILIAVPVAVIGFTGYRIGRGIMSGLTGMIRSFVKSVSDTRRTRALLAVEKVIYFAGAYAVISALVALSVGEPIGETTIVALLVGLVVGVPAAVLGAIR